jgi:branched-subunit amino acid aminotransferase/4-amino-4-deoxychorismate lyase
VLELARGAGIPVREEVVTPEALRQADEVFITSSTREVMPARTIDDRPVGDGKPGPVTRALIAAYRAAIPRYT